jgi:hypothetical protein
MEENTEQNFDDIFYISPEREKEIVDQQTKNLLDILERHAYFDQELLIADKEYAAQLQSWKDSEMQAIEDILYDLSCYITAEEIANLMARSGKDVNDYAVKWEPFGPGTEKRISEFHEQLRIENDRLFKLSKQLAVKLSGGDQEAEELFQNEMRKAKEIFKQIGRELNGIGGFKLMQESIYKAEEPGRSLKVIESSWDGIGEWVI